MSKEPRPVIVGLDALRFMAACMVMFFHFCGHDWNSVYPAMFHVAWTGTLGVEIFFVISGLVIAYSADGASVFSFFRSRVMRPYPAAWICATATAIIALLKGTDAHLLLREWGASIILYPLAPWIDPSYWTLGVEMSFYAMILFLLVINKFYYLESFTWLMGICSSIYWILGTFLRPDYLQHHLWDRRFELSLISYGCFFAIGVMTYIVSRRGLSRSRIAGLVLFTIAGLFEEGYKTTHVNTIFHLAESAYFPRILFVIVIALAFVSMGFKVNSETPLARVFRMFGLATYPLYLIHQVIGEAIIGFGLRHNVPKYAALGSAALICLTTSFVIAILIEPKIRAFLRILFAWIEVRVRKLQWFSLFLGRTKPVAIP